MAIIGLTIKTDFDDKGIKDASKKIGGFLKTGLKVGGAAAGVALAAVGAAAAAATAETINFVEQSDKAMEQLRRETGLSAESMEDFRDSATDLFALGVGEGIDDIAGAMATVNNTMQTGAEETENLTRRALTMRDVFEKDVGESIDSVKVLMDEFGLTSDQAFDFMTEGIQKGLDRNGDFLDSIREYGNLFSEGGADAAEFFSVLESGAAGGVLGTDKAADAFKEFQIRFIEGNKDLKQAFTNLGLDFDFFSEAVNDGSIEVIDVFRTVTNAIGEADTSLTSTKQTAALLGTQFEDLGADAAAGISTSTTSLQDMAGSMDRVIEKNMTIGESMDTLHRQMVVALEPVVREFMPLLAGGIQKAAEFLADAKPLFVTFADDLSQNLGPAIESISESLFRMGQALGFVPDDAEMAEGAMGSLSTVLDAVAGSVTGVANAVEFLADTIEVAAPIWEKIQEISGFSADLNLGKPFEVKEGSPLSFLANIGEELSPGGSVGEMLGFEEGGVVPGSPNQAFPIIAHGGEELANPSQGQAIVIGGEQFAVREAARMAAAINAQRQRDLQGLVDNLAEMMN